MKRKYLFYLQVKNEFHIYHITYIKEINDLFTPDEIPKIENEIKEELHNEYNTITILAFSKFDKCK